MRKHRKKRYSGNNKYINLLLIHYINLFAKTKALAYNNRMDKKYVKVKDINVLIERRKGMKYMYLSVSAKDASVRLRASKTVSLKVIEDFILKEYDKITAAVKKYKNNLKYINYEYISGEEHHLLWGRKYSLEIKTGDKQAVIVDNDTLLIYTKKEEGLEKRKALLDKFYKEELKAKATLLFEKYLQKMNLKILEFRIKNMKTRWGTCNIKDRRIWLSLALAKKPLICLEYVIVHELSHLFEKGHNKRFYTILDSYFPSRKEAESLLKIK